VDPVISHWPGRALPSASLCFLLSFFPVWVVRVLKNAVLEPSRPAAYCVSTVLCSLCMVLRVLLGLGWLWMYLAPVPLVLWFAFGVVVV